MPSEAGEETETRRRTDTGGDGLRHLGETLANIGRQGFASGREFVGFGGGWVEGRLGEGN